MERSLYSRRRFLGNSVKVAAGAGLALSGLYKAADAFAAENVLDIKILMYHEVSPARLTSDLMYHLDPRQGYQPVSPETFNWALRGDITILQGQKLFLVTMDDTRLSQYDAVSKAIPYVKDATDWFVPVVFFALTQLNDLPLPLKDIPGDTPCYQSGSNKYMVKDNCLDLLQQGHYIEWHGNNHPQLTKVNVNIRNDELVHGEERIQAFWDEVGRERNLKMLAYPFGLNDEDVRGSVKSLGYDLAFSTRQTTQHTFFNRLDLGRISMT